MKIKDWLMELSPTAGISGLTGALDTAQRELSRFAAVTRENGSLIGRIKGESDYTILFDAHIDEIGMLVTAVEEGGFVRAAKAGGIDFRTLAAQPVTIWGKKPVPGLFASTPPHLQKDGESEVSDISARLIDTGLSAAEAGALISPGDRITFRQEPAMLLGDAFTGKSLDNRAGVAALLETARLLSAQKKLPCGVTFLFSDQEELGCRGAETAAFALQPDEAVAVDVSFGDSPGLPAHKTGKLGGGGMIGISPTLSRAVTQRLTALAKEQDIPNQPEVMGGATSTNADVIALTGAGIPCGLLSIPLRSMHTTAEVIRLCDVDSAARLLTAYALSGGLKGGSVKC
ncbi:MAG: M20/M25/M40 family metallo-hydrolase [Clostridiales bacterium]|nr:M20/M25/M40 family metallo-hydrolase [Clostridiales bacterium]